MYKDNEFMRGLELYRIESSSPSSSSCNKCYLKRSNAVRRRTRPIFNNGSVPSLRNSMRRIGKTNAQSLDKTALIQNFHDNKSMKIMKLMKRNNLSYHRKLPVPVKVVKSSKDSFTIPWFLRWKYRKIHPQCDKKIQQVDGGFFERFGSLFREQVELKETQENAEQQRIVEAAALMDSEGGVAQAPTDAAEHDTDSLEGPSSSDSETEEHKDKTDLISVAFNIDELYTEVLYEILHNVGCDVSVEIGQTALFSYVQDAFKMINDKHSRLMRVAENKEAPELLLNVEVIEAKDLPAKDSNGLSDPFVTLYLASNTAHRYTTSVKPTTLSPIWEEHFALPIADNTNEETLCLEVWDFDPAESVKEKLGKIFEVKGVKGMRKLVKEIAVTAATGQHENELIGIAKVPLKTVPASGMTMWYSLDKKNKVTRQGVLKIRLTFSSEKNRQVAEQEHRHLMRIILLHELELSKVVPFWWCGTYCAQAEALLTQHVAQSGLTQVEVAICQWAVYAGIHQNHGLSFALFSNLLDKLVKPLQVGNVLCDEDVKIFWDAAKKLLPTCFAVIRKIRKKSCKVKTIVKQVTEVLQIIRKLSSLEPPDGTELFPSNLYPWTTHDGEGPNCDFETTLNDAIAQGADDWFNHIIANNPPQDDTDVHKLQHLIQVIVLVRSDLQKAIEFYDKLFQEIAGFQYAKALYVWYQSKITALVEPDVMTICKSLKRLNFTGLNLNVANSSDLLTEGTTLFEVYLALQKLVTMGQGLCPADCDEFPIKNFHQWFYGGVAQWLDIAVYKALQRIEKAVELDELVPVDASVKYSSSAVDTLAIFYQVDMFWRQLSWPDPEGCYTFIAKIIDDICRCCVFYAERMSSKVDGMGVTEDIYEKRFEVTNEWCFAINNIDYVLQSLQPFADQLGMTEVVQKLSELRNPLEAERCQKTLDNVIMNAIDTVRNSIIDLQEKVVNKMVPSMKRLLIEGAELFNQDSNSIDRLMMYIDSNLQTLHNELNEENFNRILEILWDTLSGVINEIIQQNLDKRRPPSFFANLHKTLNLMLGSFKNPEQSTSNCDNLRKTEQLLRIHGLETSDLIHHCNVELHKQFAAAKESPYGELTVRVKFEDGNLKVEIMNGNNLAVMDSNGACDSFVRIHLLPEDKFASNSKPPKTQTQNKTLFPLFDEIFTIPVPQESRNIDNAMILFSVKDKDLLGYNNQFVGEAFIPFSDIPEGDTPLGSLPQVRLQLGRPSTMDMDAVKALQHRQGDKLAKEFLKKFKQRMGS